MCSSVWEVLRVMNNTVCFSALYLVALYFLSHDVSRAIATVWILIFLFKGGEEIKVCCADLTLSVSDLIKSCGKEQLTVDVW